MVQLSTISKDIPLLSDDVVCLFTLDCLRRASTFLSPYTPLQTQSTIEMFLCKDRLTATPTDRVQLCIYACNFSAYKKFGVGKLRAHTAISKFQYTFKRYVQLHYVIYRTFVETGVEQFRIQETADRSYTLCKRYFNLGRVVIYRN